MNNTSTDPSPLPGGQPRLHGSCNCGAVQFTLAELPTEATVCHCTQCRKQSSHGFASANLPKSALDLSGGENLTWYQSSEKARRGFCSRCGSWLFWEPIFQDWTPCANMTCCTYP